MFGVFVLYLIVIGKLGFDVVGSGFVMNGFGDCLFGYYLFVVLFICEVVMMGFFLFVIFGVIDKCGVLVGFVLIVIGLCLMLIYLILILVINMLVNLVCLIGLVLFVGGDVIG